MDINEYPQSDIALILYEEAEVHLRIIHAWYTQELGS